MQNQPVSKLASVLAITQSELSLVSANVQQIADSKRRNDFTFWLIFGLSLNLGLSERLVQKVN